VEAVGDVVRAARTMLGEAMLVPWWAVAEAGASGDGGDAATSELADAWRDFPIVAQGAGGLGERQARVYDALLAHHAAAVFIGGDAPQLAPAVLVHAAQQLLAPETSTASADFVVGPAEDGGYYLFGGRRPLPRDVWTAVPYSDPGTLAALRPHLAERGRVATLPPLFDVDTADELARLTDALAAQETALLPTQRALLAWLASPARAATDVR
jgi:hypothetical protein